MAVVYLVVGMILLVTGAESLVRGASRLARTFGVSTLIIGLTVVAFGTSAPELAVSIKAALDGEANIAVGNVVGSNIFNILLILGISAILCPLVVSRQLIRLDVPVMIGVSLAVWLMALDDNFSRLDGVMLVGGLLAYSGFLIVCSRRKMAQDALAIESVTGSSKSVWWVDSLLVFAGLVLLLLGARWFLFGAVSLAQWLGISELVIGLTVVAVGTSLPEVVTSVVASIRGERDIAVGNVVGSNLFNLLGVLGLATMFSTGGIVVEPSVISRDLPVMFFAAVACLPIFFTGGRISRWEGGFLLASYLVYTVYVILDATRHPLFAEFGWMTRRVIVPVVVLAVVWIIVKAIRESALTGPRIRDNP